MGFVCCCCCCFCHFVFKCFPLFRKVLLIFRIVAVRFLFCSLQHCTVSFVIDSMLMWRCKKKKIIQFGCVLCFSHRFFEIHSKVKINQVKESMSKRSNMNNLLPTEWTIKQNALTNGQYIKFWKKNYRRRSSNGCISIEIIFVAMLRKKNKNAQSETSMQ